ncbi:hypothetical protein HK102_000946 [Quaeritorhiza haematococci]|nr:hypothetical protein HK102_000946 [Quaeritorhiza haematococci]
MSTATPKCTSPKYPCRYNHLTWYGVHGAALAGTGLSLMGAAYIIYTVIQERRRKKKALKFAEMLPLLLVLTDVWFNLTHGVDHLYSVITNDVAGGAACQFFGWGTVVGYNINAFMNILAAVYVFVAVYFSRTINWGKKFWIAYLVGFLIPIVIGTVPLIVGQIVDVGLFCNIKTGTAAVLYARIVPQFTAVFLCLTLYILVYSKIYLTTRTLSALKIETTDSLGQISRKSEDKLLRKGAMLIGFAIVYVVQWGQITVLQIVQYGGGVAPPSALISAVLFGNAGGFWTAIRYYQIQRDKARKRALKINTSKTASSNAFNAFNVVNASDPMVERSPSVRTGIL